MIESQTYVMNFDIALWHCISDIEPQEDTFAATEIRSPDEQSTVIAVGYRVVHLINERIFADRNG